MRRAAKFLAIMLAILGTAGMAYAQTPATQQQNETEVTGTVVSVDDQLLVIRTDEGQLRLDITATTEQPSRDLRAGDRVRVWHHTDATTGNSVVTRITLAEDTTAGMQAEREDQRVAAREDTRDERAATRDRDIEQDPYAPRDDAMARDELPRTAGSSPLVALLGAIAIVGAAGLHFAGRLF